jgi:hypothetical protein
MPKQTAESVLLPMRTEGHHRERLLAVLKKREKGVIPRFGQVPNSLTEAQKPNDTRAFANQDGKRDGQPE